MTHTALMLFALVSSPRCHHVTTAREDGSEQRGGWRELPNTALTLDQVFLFIQTRVALHRNVEARV